VTGLLQAAPSPEIVGPGFAGFLAIFAVAVATVLLLRSMVGHLRKVRYSPDPVERTGEDGPETASSSDTGVSSRETGVSPPETGKDTPGRDA
jgi:hypothetical protein